MKISSKNHFLHIFLWILLVPPFISGQVPVSTPDGTADRKSPETEANLIHIGDLVDVDVIGSVEYDWRGTLNPEGFLNGISFVENPIFALCRNEEDTAAEIAKSYSKLLRDPKVVVRILDRSSRPLSIVYGAIKTPQRFQIKRPVMLNELLIVSGGITDKASGEIQIFRAPSLNCISQINNKSDQKADSADDKEKFVRAGLDNGPQYINIKISDLLAGGKEANPQILSGDVITVLEAQPIYLIGGVANPKQIATNSKITLTRAIAGAGGIVKNADESKISIFRRSGNETKIIAADLGKIKAGQAEDIELQAYDIVEVEQTGREKRKFTPPIKIDDTDEKNPAKLPLRIIE